MVTIQFRFLNRRRVEKGCVDLHLGMGFLVSEVGQSLDTSLVHLFTTSLFLRTVLPQSNLRGRVFNPLYMGK